MNENNQETSRSTKPFIDAANKVKLDSLQFDIPPEVAKALNKLREVYCPPATPAVSVFKEPCSIKPINLAEIERNKQEAQAQSIADAMGETIQEVLKDQNKINETHRKVDRRTLWLIAVATILGAGITSFAGTYFANYLSSPTESTAAIKTTDHSADVKKPSAPQKATHP